LLELDLLEPVQANIHTRQGDDYAMTGFHTVDRKKLKQLDNESLNLFVQEDYLELFHAH